MRVYHSNSNIECKCMQNPCNELCLRYFDSLVIHCRSSSFYALIGLILYCTRYQTADSGPSVDDREKRLWKKKWTQTNETIRLWRLLVAAVFFCFKVRLIRFLLEYCEPESQVVAVFFLSIHKNMQRVWQLNIWFCFCFSMLLLLFVSPSSIMCRTNETI